MWPNIAGEENKLKQNILCKSITGNQQTYKLGVDLYTQLILLFTIAWFLFKPAYQRGYDKY